MWIDYLLESIMLQQAHTLVLSDTTYCEIIVVIEKISASGSQQASCVMQLIRPELLERGSRLSAWLGFLRPPPGCGQQSGWQYRRSCRLQILGRFPEHPCHKQSKLVSGGGWAVAKGYQSGKNSLLFEPPQTTTNTNRQLQYQDSQNHTIWWPVTEVVEVYSYTIWWDALMHVCDWQTFSVSFKPSWVFTPAILALTNSCQIEHSLLLNPCATLAPKCC